MLRRPLSVLLAVVVLMAAVSAVSASAAPPHADSSACSSPTLSGPGSVSVGNSYTLEGCGFKPNSLVPIEVTESGGCCIAYNVLTDSSGRLTVVRSANSSGYYRVRASGQRRNGRWIVVAEWSAMAS